MVRNYISVNLMLIYFATALSVLLADRIGLAMCLLTIFSKIQGTKKHSKYRGTYIK